MADYLIPDDLKPIPELDRSVLPEWISDVGKLDPDDECPAGYLVMVARGPNGQIFHCDTPLPAAFDDTFGERYAAPMVHNLGGAVFDAEFPDLYMQTFRWEAEARELTDRERKIIARRNELTWKPPAIAG